MLLKIGELAKRTGITVRTLHHYDKLKLLSPSVRSESGYRMYNRADIARLHRIQALRRLNLSLAEIAQLIAGNAADLQTVIEQQIQTLDEQIRQNTELRDRLRELDAQLQTHHEPNLEYWLSTLEMMSVRAKYFSPQEITQLQQQAEVNSGKMDKAIQPIVTGVRALMDANVAATDPRALKLAQEWLTTVHQAIPDIRLLHRYADMHKNEPSLQAMLGFDEAMMNYLNIAAIEIRYQIYRKYLSEEECQYFRASFIKHREAWNTLFVEIRNLMTSGAKPNDEASLVYIRQWRSMFAEAWNYDLNVIQKVRKVHELEPSLTNGGGLNQEVLTFVIAGMRYLESQ
jgi:DNA-binding transcriptional MerR regulator